MRDYLPGLNTIRLYAAFSVLVVHLPKEGNELLRVLTLDANPAVTMFFVVSGYLITYRLLVERQRFGNFNLRAFYIRRELRILPLYYLAVFIGGILLPMFGFDAPGWGGKGLFFTLIMLPQVAVLARYGGMGMMTHLWSIGVEEFFYLFFPFLLHKRIRLVKLALAIIIGSTLLGLLAQQLHPMLYSVARNMRFECMAIGALAAWAHFTQSRWLRLIYAPLAQIGVIVALAAVAAFDFVFPVLDDILFSTLVAVLLLNVSSNPKSLLRLEWRGSQLAGNLTYGIYVWHFIILHVLINYGVSGLALTGLTIVLTLLTAYLSYRYIEKPLLGLKDRLQPRLAPA